MLLMFYHALSADNFVTDGLIVPVDMKPDVSGTLQNFTVPVPWAGETWYYAMVAIDASGNRAGISNVASVFIALPDEPDYDDGEEILGNINLQLQSPEEKNGNRLLNTNFNLRYTNTPTSAATAGDESAAATK